MLTFYLEALENDGLDWPPLCELGKGSYFLTLYLNIFLNTLSSINNELLYPDMGEGPRGNEQVNITILNVKTIYHLHFTFLD